MEIRTDLAHSLITGRDAVLDKLQDCILHYLHKIGCNYREKPGENLYTFSVRGHNGIYPMMVYARTPFLICVVGFPAVIPDTRRLEVAEYLHRVNFGLLLGSFEIDYDIGNIRFRTALATDASDIGEEILERYIQMPAAIMDRYAAGILAIAEEGEIASVALEMVEN